MKNLTVIAGIVVALNSYGQSTTNFESPDLAKFNDLEAVQVYKQFLENQKTSFLRANSEVFVLDKVIWTRIYGETEYCLTPAMKNIEEYEKRVRQLNDSEKGVFKSNFYFINVESTAKSKMLLKQMSIDVPSYVSGNVNVYLPEIDIDNLGANGVSFSILKDYGKKIGAIEDDNAKSSASASVIWSENFESNTVPGSNYNAVNGSVNCGWQTVSCYNHAGSKSVWCAGEGAACNPCLDNYVNDMSTAFANATYINVSSYTDIYFNYWIDLDLNNTGTNDEFNRYDDLGFGTWSLQFTATSANSWDGQLWQSGSVNYTGQSFTQYAFQFGFTSNFTGTSYGVYLDDLQLTGTATVGIGDIDIISHLNILPNPNTGRFTLDMELANPENFQIKVVNLVGQVVYQEEVKVAYAKYQKTIDLSGYPKGVYNLELITKTGTLNRKVVIQ